MTHVVRALGRGKLAIELLGAPQGKPVFLLHGTPGSRYGPRPRGIVLYRLGIRLISYDRPGYGGSERQPDRTVADAARDVATIADHLGIDRFSVIGRSGGGPHALACAAILNRRVICAAALGSLAPYDADGLDWSDGMTDSNKRAYFYAATDSTALEKTLCQQAEEVRNSSESLLNWLEPELVGRDREIIGDVTLRQMIATTHAKALRDTTDGWIDDVIALSRPWKFDLSDITAPVKLWHGSDDVFSPASHTQWLAGQIGTEPEVKSGAAHFGAVEILPRILNWVAEKANAEARGAGMPASASVG